MPILSGIEQQQLNEAKAALGPAWDRAYNHNPKFELGDLEYYKNFSKYRFLGTLDFLVSHISEEGILNTDEAMSERENDDLFYPEIFHRAVDMLAEYWPDIASLLVRVS